MTIHGLHRLLNNISVVRDCLVTSLPGSSIVFQTGVGQEDQNPQSYTQQTSSGNQSSPDFYHHDCSGVCDHRGPAHLEKSTTQVAFCDSGQERWGLSECSLGQTGIHCCSGSLGTGDSKFPYCFRQNVLLPAVRS